jgi:hypothetical protein
MSGIAQGILTNFDYTFELQPSIAERGTFGGDIYTTSASWGMPMAIATTIRMIGFVTTVPPTNPASTLTMSLVNRTSGVTRAWTFTNWTTNSLQTRALSPVMDIAQGDLIYIDLVSSVANMNITQILATYDLQTPV